MDFNGAFASIQFQNKTRAVIHGLGNTDTINLNNPLTATGLSVTNVEGGDNNDVINIQSSHIGDLNGGSGNDTFVFSDGADVAGEMANAVNGGSGQDTLDVQAFTTSLNATLTSNTVDGYTGTLPSVLPGGSFTGVDQISAGSGVDTLSGLSTTATWNLDGSDTYTDTSTFRALSFDGFEDLVGADMADVFEINGVRQFNLDGQAGNDVFRFQADDAVVDGFILGDAGMDTLDFSNFSSSAAVVVTLSNSGVSGFDGMVAAVTGGFTDIDLANAGSSAADALTGINAVGAWTVDDPGTYLASGQTLTFSDFENLSGNDMADIFMIEDGSFQLSGGNGDDTFNFSDGVAFTGMINGDDGDPADDGTMDTVNFGLSTTSVSIGLSQLSNIEIIDGSIPGNDTIEGTDGNDVFEISGADTGTANGAAFMGFGELDGGLGDDSFQFVADAGVLSGAIEGGAGADTLGFSGVSGNVMIDLSGTGGADGFNGTESGGALIGFTNINTLQGGLGTGDTLTGLDLDSTWTLDTTSTYAAATASVQFVLNTGSGFENLVGQSRDDVFNVTGTQAASLTTGDGADEVNLAAAAVLTGSVSTGADDDSLRFETGAMIAGPVDAGADDDVLDFASSTTDVDFTLSFADVAGGFAGNAPALITFTPTFASDASDFNTGTTSLAFTAVKAGAPGNVISVTVGKADLGMGALPAVSVAGSMVNVTLNTNAGFESTADNVVTAVTADMAAAALIGVTLTAGVGTTDITTPADPVTNLLLNGGLDAVTGINAIVGGTGQNSLTGVGTDSTWTIGSTNTYVEDSDLANTLGFSGFGSAIGGAGMDLFAVNATTPLNLSGGDNDDSFNVVGTASVTGSLNGDAGDDLFTFSGAALVPAALDGGADTDTVDFSTSITAVSINLDTFTNVEMVSGTTISDTITGSSGNDDFTVAGSNNSGSVVSGGTGVTTAFSSFENLVGAGGSDNFIIADGIGLSGAVDGGADIDTLDYAAYTTDITVNLTT
ncbi:MAG: hypothetical protein VB858_08405, partial [Planctomycetaceae bacterium]